MVFDFLPGTQQTVVDFEAAQTEVAVAQDLVGLPQVPAAPIPPKQG